MSNVPINYLLKDALVLGKQTGTDLQLLKSTENKLLEFDIKGNSIQNGEPSLENKVDIKSCGDKRKYKF